MEKLITTMIKSLATIRRAKPNFFLLKTKNKNMAKTKDNNQKNMNFWGHRFT